MLFNSFVFVLVFLPVVLLCYHRLGRSGLHDGAIAWLVCASLFFYGWWNPAYLALILGSVLFNYYLGLSLSRLGSKGGSRGRWLLATGVGVNLALLGYFKYANFFVENVNAIFGSTYTIEVIVLPLAISFFTFQQIAYLVDAHAGQAREHSFLHYCLFVTFFPQLIAGPIVHHREMLPQFTDRRTLGLAHEDLAIGFTIFAIGLFKKVILADGVAGYATPVFDAAEGGATLTFFEAWGGALAYTLQLYFDFSGYSDMAIGLARLFGIKLPLNFHSPYKAPNIIEFWRRWHMTLSRFLRDYVYILLGGSRKGSLRRYQNLMITMLLGGLWHGAGWTFVMWGGLHGVYLMVNHGWRAVVRSLGLSRSDRSTVFGRALGVLFTFLAVVVSWVFFRAESFPAALVVLKGMCGLNGFVLSPTSFEAYGGLIRSFLEGVGVRFDTAGSSLFSGIDEIAWIATLMALVWFLPNTQQIMERAQPALDFSRWAHTRRQAPLVWAPTPIWAFAVGVILIASIASLGEVSEFLYFQF